MIIGGWETEFVHVGTDDRPDVVMVPHPRREKPAMMVGACVMRGPDNGLPLVVSPVFLHPCDVFNYDRDKTVVVGFGKALKAISNYELRDFSAGIKRTWRRLMWNEFWAKTGLRGRVNR